VVFVARRERSLKKFLAMVDQAAGFYRFMWNIILLLAVIFPLKVPEKIFI